MDANTNSLSLDPEGDFGEEIAEWKDGETYTLNVKVRQTAPGEFDVLEVTEAGEESEPDEPAPMKHKNPAMSNLMSDKS